MLYTIFWLCFMGNKGKDYAIQYKGKTRVKKKEKYRCQDQIDQGQEVVVRRMV